VGVDAANCCEKLIRDKLLSKDRLISRGTPEEANRAKATKQAV